MSANTLDELPPIDRQRISESLVGKDGKPLVGAARKKAIKKALSEWNQEHDSSASIITKGQPALL